MELPANVLTPTVSRLILCRATDPIACQAFCERVKEAFRGIPNVEIFVRDEGRLISNSCSLTINTPFYFFQHGR
jgi:hypothetical protein